MTDAELERQRKLLHEAFTAGWQAALAVKVTSPSVLAVIESCFELWLEEEVDERGVLGLPFRRRYDLPRPRGSHAGPRPGPTNGPKVRRGPREPVTPSQSPARNGVTQAAVSDLPRQRRQDGSEREVETSGTGF